MSEIGQTPEGLAQTQQSTDTTPKRRGFLGLLRGFKGTPASTPETPTPTQTGADTQKRIDNLGAISALRSDGSPRMTTPQESAPPTPPPGPTQGK